MNADELLEKTKVMAKDIYTELGGGYLESAYEEAMGFEFRKNSIGYDVQKTTEIFYKGYKVGTHQLDFIIENTVVVELKAVSSITKSHAAQLRSYLKTLGLVHGIIVNFPYPDKNEPDFEVVILEKI